MDLRSLLRCPSCSSALALDDRRAACRSCGAGWPVSGGIPRFVSGALHENFAIQWKRYADVQLDSRNGTTQTRDRLLLQSGLAPGDFSGKTVLEVGCGAGRFTEVLLGFGARMLSMDYSAAVEANAATHAAAAARGELALAQADVFALPAARGAFDLVVGYGMLQHTGDPDRALSSLWERVRPGGLLLVDRYQMSWRHVEPLKYLIRPIVLRMEPGRALALAEAVCRLLVPAQRALLRRLRGGGPRKLLRALVNRSPNSVYPINLEAEGLLDRDTAFRWSVLDTFDMWAPLYDDPCSAAAWKRALEALPGGEVARLGSGGQGNYGAVRRRGRP